MNWNTNVPLGRRQDGDDECEHVTAGEPAVTILRENDTFGPVSGLVVCAKCRDESQEAAMEEEECCRDCGSTFKVKDGTMYRWFEFDPRQGDEEMPICGTCMSSPTHIARVERDKRDYEAEMAWQDSHDDHWTY